MRYNQDSINSSSKECSSNQTLLCQVWGFFLYDRQMLVLPMNKHGQAKVPAAILLLVIHSFLSDLWDAEVF